MSKHYRRGDATNASIRTLLYTVGCEHDNSLYGKSLINEAGLVAHKSEAMLLQGNKCLYCRKDFGANLSMEKDHILPMEKRSAGIHSWGNVLYACSKCNQGKGNTEEQCKKFTTCSQETINIISEWQKRYNSGSITINHSLYKDVQSLQQACNDLYSEIDLILQKYKII